MITLSCAKLLLLLLLRPDARRVVPSRDDAVEVRRADDGDDDAAAARARAAVRVVRTGNATSSSPPPSPPPPPPSASRHAARNRRSSLVVINASTSHGGVVALASPPPATSPSLSPFPALFPATAARTARFKSSGDVNAATRKASNAVPAASATPANAPPLSSIAAATALAVSDASASPRTILSTPFSIAAAIAATASCPGGAPPASTASPRITRAARGFGRRPARVPPRGPNPLLLFFLLLQVLLNLRALVSVVVADHHPRHPPAEVVALVLRRDVLRRDVERVARDVPRRVPQRGEELHPLPPLVLLLLRPRDRVARVEQHLRLQRLAPRLSAERRERVLGPIEPHIRHDAHVVVHRRAERHVDAVRELVDRVRAASHRAVQRRRGVAGVVGVGDVRADVGEESAASECLDVARDVVGGRDHAAYRAQRQQEIVRGRAGEVRLPVVAQRRDALDRDGPRHDGGRAAGEGGGGGGGGGGRRRDGAPSLVAELDDDRARAVMLDERADVRRGVGREDVRDADEVDDAAGGGDEARRARRVRRLGRRPRGAALRDVCGGVLGRRRGARSRRRRRARDSAAAARASERATRARRRREMRRRRRHGRRARRGASAFGRVRAFCWKQTDLFSRATSSTTTRALLGRRGASCRWRPRRVSRRRSRRAVRRADARTRRSRRGGRRVGPRRRGRRRARVGTRQ
eukprot:31304-Pelagococcus_subviridis.AAC.2